MFTNIMVPLDGSRLAEAALPAAAYLAAAAGATVTLLHVLEQHPPAAVHGERHLARADEAETYLADVAQRVFPPGVPVTCHVHTTAMTDVVRGLAEHVAELAPDLVIMCTHGRGGLRALLYGSIAQRVVAESSVPLLLIRPAGPAAAGFACRHILAPFDGDPAHARGVETAGELALLCRAELHLVFAVPTVGTLGAEQAAPSRLLPAASRTLLDLASREARACLAGWLQRLQARGVTATGEVRRGRPVRVIVRAAAARQADLIVLATHGKAGSRAFWAESMAQQILHHTPQPLLLVPVRAAAGE